MAKQSMALSRLCSEPKPAVSATPKKIRMASRSSFLPGIGAPPPRLTRSTFRYSSGPPAARSTLTRCRGKSPAHICWLTPPANPSNSIRPVTVLTSSFRQRHSIPSLPCWSSMLRIPVQYRHPDFTLSTPRVEALSGLLYHPEYGKLFEHRVTSNHSSSEHMQQHP